MRSRLTGTASWRGARRPGQMRSLMRGWGVHPLRRTPPEGGLSEGESRLTQLPPERTPRTTPHKQKPAYTRPYVGCGRLPWVPYPPGHAFDPLPSFMKPKPPSASEDHRMWTTTTTSTGIIGYYYLVVWVFPAGVAMNDIRSPSSGATFA
ncbi:unnamed protein product [Arctogadus glacialis]